ncbi:S28 family serine protease [Aureibacter tunicatorum]|uniref:PS-10 peptidase S37 n=1 Tax=Aureibacter tunicatorum TaxID=866807 RepID=A0AAE3XLR2_9BACT|nr:S28 family serine protease [Aureibacter tunicatorum]MDR6240246.1 hypothetical protein [Aureibacter tunicatorum]BDD05873.1 tripeptidyl aminopeptidase [Aureibacter tunicatorum]
MKRYLIPFFLIFVLCAACDNASNNNEKAEKISLDEIIQKIPGLRVSDTLATLPGYEFCYEIYFTQPLDHQDPSKGTFEQRMYWSHKDANMPMVMETEGYNIRKNRLTPVNEILEANQLMVEHRYFGKSLPDSLDYDYLYIQQQIDDYHRIKELFSKVYNKEWISTGFSKGGENTLIYKSKYPNDIAVAVPEVAPIILSNEDERTTAFLDTVGTDQCRQKLIDFQRTCLENSDFFLPQIEQEAKEKGYKYTTVSPLGALEYAVLEFTFAFWQWGYGKCEDIPVDKSDLQAYYDYLKYISPVSYFKDRPHAFDRKSPPSSAIMHQREYGYYAFDRKNIQDLLVAAPNATNRTFAPKEVDIEYDPSYIAEVNEWLKDNGNDIIYIYGAADTWTGCAVNPTQNVNALKFMVPGGSHSTRIRDLNDAQKEEVIKYLEARIDGSISRDYIEKSKSLPKVK